MNYYEIGSLLLAFIALIISVLAYGQQSLNSISNKIDIDKANKIAQDANDISQKALNIAMNEHKIRILPDIIGHVQEYYLMVDDPSRDSIIFLIKNKAHSKVALISYSLMGQFYEIQGLKTELPRILSLNNSHEIHLCLHPNTRKSMANNAIRKETKSFESDNERYIGRDFFLDDTVRFYLGNLRINVVYKDELNNTFNSLLSFDRELNKYIGEPEALSDI